MTTRVRALVCGVVATLALGLVGTGGVGDAYPYTLSSWFHLANRTPIALGASGTSNMTSEITKTKLPGVVTHAEVYLYGLRHEHPEDLDIELVGPDGTAVALMSDACGGSALPANDDSIAFRDHGPSSAMTSSATCNDFQYLPSNADNTTDTWAVAPNATALSAFDGSDPNGPWQLYVSDDSDGAGGGLDGGWGLSIVTSKFPPVSMQDWIATQGIATPWPVRLEVSGRSEPVSDVNLTLADVTHDDPSKLDVMLRSPTGRTFQVMSAACGSEDVDGVTWSFDDQAGGDLPRTGCGSGTYRPTGQTDPYSIDTGPRQSLAVFNGTPANGTWELYIRGGTAYGYMLSPPVLTVTTADVTAPETSLRHRPKDGPGRTRRLVLVSSEATSTFQFKLDHGRWKSCGPKLRLTHLSTGRHTMRVRAVDAAGNVDPRPAKASWRVLRRR